MESSQLPNNLPTRRGELWRTTEPSIKRCPDRFGMDSWRGNKSGSQRRMYGSDKCGFALLERGQLGQLPSSKDRCYGRNGVRVSRQISLLAFGQCQRFCCWARWCGNWRFLAVERRSWKRRRVDRSAPDSRGPGQFCVHDTLLREPVRGR